MKEDNLRLTTFFRRGIATYIYVQATSQEISVLNEISDLSDPRTETSFHNDFMTVLYFVYHHFIFVHFRLYNCNN